MTTVENARTPLSGPEPSYGTAEWFDFMATDDRWGQCWRGAQTVQYRSHLNLVRPHLQHRSCRILDVGSATGEFGARLKALHPRNRLIGIDISPVAVAIARQRHPDCRFEVQALPELTFPDAAFDFLSAVEVVDYLSSEDRRRTFATFARVLEPGGLLLFSGGINSGPSYFAEAEVLDLLRDDFEIVKTRYYHARAARSFERWCRRWRQRFEDNRVAGWLSRRTGRAQGSSEESIGDQTRECPPGFIGRLLGQVARAGRFITERLIETSLIPTFLCVALSGLPPRWSATQLHVLARRKGPRPTALPSTATV